MNILGTEPLLVLRKVYYQKDYYLFLNIFGAFQYEDSKIISLDDIEEISYILEKDSYFLKKKRELLIKGFCYPSKNNSNICKVKVKCSHFCKELVVFGNRYWIKKAGIWRKSESEPFTQMEISWENAFGGPGYEKNPVGKGFASIKTETGEEIWPLPNIEDPNNLIVSPRDRPEPAGFLPYEPTWPQRAQYLGTYDEKWLRERWPWLPEDFDPTFFNAAPPDQQIEGYFRGDEEIVIENMHPEKPVIRTRLPGIRARCFVNQKMEEKLEFREVLLNLDTLWLIPHREIGIFVWRGVLPVKNEDAEDIKHLLVITEVLTETPKEPEYYRQLMAQEIAQTEVPIEEDSLDESEDELELSDKIFKVPSIEDFLDSDEKKLFQYVDQVEKRLEKELKERGYNPDTLAKKAKEAVPLTDDIDELMAWAEKKTYEYELAIRKNLKEMGYDSTIIKKQEKKSSYLFKDKIMEEQIIKELKNFKDNILPNLTILGPIENIKELASGIEAHIKDLEEMTNMVKVAPIDQQEFEKRVKREQNFEGKHLEVDLSNKDLEGFNFRKANLEGLNLSKANLKKVDFSEANLSEANMKGVDLRGASLRGADLSEVDLSEANLSGADLSGAILSGANLSGADLSGAKLQDCEATGANFTKADLSEADLSGGTFGQTRFVEANLSGANLKEADFSESTWEECFLEKVQADEADFTGATFSKVNFARSSLIYADFSGTQLKEVNFSQVKASNVFFDGAKGENLVFTGADLTQSRADEETAFLGADFRGANLTGACWEGADLNSANFEGAILDGANFSKANLTGANFYHTSAKEATFTKTIFDRARLVAANFFRAGFEEVSLVETDLRGANLYEVEFWKARLANSLWEKANLKMTKLFGKVRT